MRIQMRRDTFFVFKRHTPTTLIVVSYNHTCDQAQDRVIEHIHREPDGGDYGYSSAIALLKFNHVMMEGDVTSFNSYSGIIREAA